MRSKAPDAAEADFSRVWSGRAVQDFAMIVGLGVDIAEVERIKAAIERRGDAFLRRVFTSAEREYCERFKNKFERYAGRFAAKEAAMKALGTGWRSGVRWQDLSIIRERSGRPTMALSGEAGQNAQTPGGKKNTLSNTRTGVP